VRGYKHLIWAGLLAAAVVALDQAAKALVTDRIEPGELVHVLGPLDFTVSHNDGVAFGLAGGGGILVILLASIALVALGAFIASAPESNLTWISGGLILGGAAGNLIDRVRIGHVTDFILFPSWPAFNLADCAITVGVVLLAVALIWGDQERQEGEGSGGPHRESEADGA
jgi:signal peptidase II